MPLLAGHVFRAVVVLVLAAHVFYMYCMARAMGESFGFRVTVAAVAALFALVMLVPLVWAVTIPELPEIYLRHTRPRWRWKHGRCPRCGYAMRGLASESACPECGAARVAPEAYRVGRHTVLLFIVLNVLAWGLGCTAGEVWMQRDELDFRAQVTQQATLAPVDRFARMRRWPNANSMMIYSTDGGFRSSD